MIGRVNTGGGSGCILTITAVASETVTISKNGKSKSKTADSKGVAVFRGLDTGKWTITIVRGGVPITRVVAVTADYSVAIPLFAATINITYPSGSTCTCSDGTTTLSAPDTSGTWACIVPNAGTWTAAATDGEKNASETVSINTDGQIASIELSYRALLYQAGDTSDKWQYESMYINTSYKKATAPTVNVESDSMMITQPTYVNCCAYVYNREIDMTTLNTLRFDGELSTAMTNFTDAACLCIWTSLGTYVTDNRVAYINFKTASPKQIDVSALTGMHRVGFFLFSNGTYAKVNSLLIE
jgi:hypothetical protein